MRVSWWNKIAANAIASRTECAPGADGAQVGRGISLFSAARRQRFAR